MMPIALAARDASGPAEIVLTRDAELAARLEREHARVALERRLRRRHAAAVAGITRSPAMYVSDTNEPPRAHQRAERCTSETIE